MKTLFTAILISTMVTLNAQEDDRGYIVKVGDMAPDFEMTLTTGEIVKLSDLRGKIVMLQFTASWCGVCRKEMPFIEKDIWLPLKDREDFALYGIDRDEPLEKVIWFGDKIGISYPLALDPGAELFQLFALKDAGVTRNIIIDRAGKIIYLTRLYNPEEFNAMKEVIFKLIDS